MALLVICTTLCHNLRSQSILSGTLVKSNYEVLDYAEVVIYDTKDTPIKHTLADNQGNFQFNLINGNYRLEVREFGSVIFQREVDINKDVDLGSIIVKNDILLDEVVISSRKKTVERRTDRLVFNLDNTISSVGGDALDALRITPGVLIQNNTITMVGRGSPRVMIDGRLIELTGEPLVSYIQSIPAANISKIEIITTPPARYESLGNSGLINIQLKKAKSNSQSITLGSHYLHRSYDDEYGASSTFLYNKNKLNLRASLNYADGAMTFIYFDKINYPVELWKSEQSYNRKFTRLNSVLGAEYNVLPKWKIGAQYIGNFNTLDGDRKSNINVQEYKTNNKKKEIVADSYVMQKPTFNSGNFFNEIELDTLGKKILLNLDYFSYENADSRPYSGQFASISPLKNQVFDGINNNNSLTQNYSAKVDITLPSESINWSFGGKLSFSTTDNNIATFNSGLVDVKPDKSLEVSDFSYDENVQAIYISGNKKQSDKLDIQMGARLELTQTKSLDTKSQQTYVNNYYKVFPSLNISYMTGESSRLIFGYNKRVGRPSFSSLNPNASFLNPFFSIQGNPLLQPYFTDNVELSYIYKNLEAKVFYSYEENMDHQIGYPDTDNYSIRLISSNLYDITRVGFSGSFTFDKYEWWTSYNSLNVNHFTNKTLEDIPAEGLVGFYSTFNSNNDITLTKNLKLGVNFMYIPAGIYGINDLDPDSNTAITIQYTLLNNDLKLALRANDVFRTNRSGFGSNVSGVYRYGNYYNDSQYVQFSASYKIGSKKLNFSKRSTGNEEEKRRTNN